MGIISWIIFGLIAGALAKWIMPGKDSGGLILTSVLGIVGAFVGGFVGSLFGLGTTGGFSVMGLITAVGGALRVLFAYRRFAKWRLSDGRPRRTAAAPAPRSRARAGDGCAASARRARRVRAASRG